jgi:hypothetical protein
MNCRAVDGNHEDLRMPPWLTRSSGCVQNATEFTIRSLKVDAYYAPQ